MTLDHTNNSMDCSWCHQHWTTAKLETLKSQDFKIGICCFSAKHAALRSKSKDWLARSQNNMSEWVNMFICGVLFQ